jgi:glutamate carboxypeptidase
VRTQQEAENVHQAIMRIKPSTAGVTLNIEGGVGRPAMEKTPRNESLWRLAKDLGEEIGLDLDSGQAGGGSDGNTTSQYTATLDGLGAVGDGAHAHHEFLYIDKMTERAALLALLLMSPPAE